MNRNDLAAELKKIIRGDVSITDKDIALHSRDASVFKVEPKVVVYPKNKADIARLVGFVNLQQKNGEQLTLTARARGTGMTGGSLSDSIVVNVDRYLNNEVIDLDKLRAEIESGVEYTLFENETLPSHVTMPAYPSSKNFAAFGGMIMNDCAGEKALRYGKMHKFVESIEMVLSDGSTVTFGEVGREEIKDKMSHDTFEASIYRQLIPLLEKHQKIIDQHHPAVSKNSSGYALWRVWDKEKDTFNLAQLLTGSQGTLGIMTRANVRLQKEKEARQLIVVFVSDWGEFPEIVNTVLPHDPEMLEAYDDTTLRVALDYSSQLAKSLNISRWRLRRLFKPERAHESATGSLPKLTLLIELAEDDELSLNTKLGNVEEALSEEGLSYQVVADKRMYQKYWAVRRDSYKLLKDNTPGITATVFIEDFCIEPRELPSFFPKLLLILQEAHIKATIAGHAGNGNFHIIPLMDLEDEGERAKIIPVMKQVHELIWQHGGTISGEHNDGILRTPFVEEQFGRDMYKLFREVKRIFDPNNIFNPGKKVGGTLEDLEQKLIKENPDQETKKIYA